MKNVNGALKTLWKIRSGVGNKTIKMQCMRLLPGAKNLSQTDPSPQETIDQLNIASLFFREKFSHKLQLPGIFGLRRKPNPFWYASFRRQQLAMSRKQLHKLQINAINCNLLSHLHFFKQAWVRDWCVLQRHPIATANSCLCVVPSNKNACRWRIK